MVFWTCELCGESYMDNQEAIPYDRVCEWCKREQKEFGFRKKYKQAKSSDSQKRKNS